MTEPEPLQQAGRTFVRVGKRKLVYFSGCDYFRLASDPRLLSSFKAAASRHNLSAAASRLTTGNHTLYLQIERKVANFFEAPDALLVSSGYVTNLVVAQALAGAFSHALIDERSHPSLRDAAQILGCPVIQFRHRDTADFERCLHRCGGHARPILLTDGMFARDGAVAPLAEYLAMLPRDGRILVDDAHGAGVLGMNGRGTLEHCGVSRSRIIQTITLSKAFGVYGGVILGNPALRRRILEHSNLFVGSTPPPLALVCAAIRSVEILKSEGRQLRKRLQQNLSRLRSRLLAAGCRISENPGPILPILPSSPTACRRLGRLLEQNGIYPPFIRYPGAPRSGYFRFVVSSEHTGAQLDKVAGVLGEQCGTAE